MTFTFISPLSNFNKLFALSPLACYIPFLVSIYTDLLKKPELFSHKDTKTQREDEHKSNNGVFSLMRLTLISICHVLMRLRRIKKAVTVHGFRGSGLNENPPAIRRAGLKSLTSKVNERNVTLNLACHPSGRGEP